MRESKPEKSRSSDANIVFKTIKNNAMVDCAKSSAMIKQHQQGSYIAFHGKKNIVYCSGHSSLCGIESPFPD